MTRRTLARWSVLLLAMSGLLALLAIDQLTMSATTMVLCLTGSMLRSKLPALPWGPMTVVGLLLAIVSGVGLGLGLVQIAALSLAVLLVARIWSRAGPTDDRVVVVLTLLMLVLAAARTTSPWMLAACLLWTSVAPVAALLSHLEVTSRRAASSRAVGSHLLWIAVGTTALTAVAFFALPRIRPADLGGHQPSDNRAIGFSDHVQLGELGELLNNPAAVLRITPLDDVPTGRVYIRGTTLDRFDGKAWRAAAPEAELSQSSTMRSYRVLHEADAGPVVFSPGPAVQVQIDAPGAVSDRDGNWRLAGAPRRLSYTVRVPVEPLRVTPTEQDLLRWTGLPPTLDARIFATAEQLTADAKDRTSAANNVQRWLLSDFDYTWAPRDEALESPLETFLYDRKTGHCEYFSTSMAVLLRARGIPVRVVNGFSAPEWNETGNYWIVRQANAHSWVEVLDEQGQWQRFDPTPGGSRPPPQQSAFANTLDALDTTWHEGVLGYDWSVQVGMLRSAGWRMQGLVTGSTPDTGTPWLGVLLIVGPFGSGIFLVGWALQTVGRRLAGERPTRPTGRVARVHARMRHRMHRLGWDVPPALPPVAAAAWLKERAPAAGQDLEELAWLHYRVRYGGEDDLGLSADARLVARRLRKSLQRPSRS